jgi:hypothetical protein
MAAEVQLFPEAAPGSEFAMTGDGASPSAWSPVMFEFPSDDYFANSRNKELVKGVFEESRKNLVRALAELSPSADQAIAAKARRVWSSFPDEMSKIAARKGKRTGSVHELTRSKDEWLKALRAKDEL